MITNLIPESLYCRYGMVPHTDLKVILENLEAVVYTSQILRSELVIILRFQETCIYWRKNVDGCRYIPLQGALAADPIDLIPETMSKHPNN